LIEEEEEEMINEDMSPIVYQRQMRALERQLSHHQDDLLS
jgi:hypothetical protein